MAPDYELFFLPSIISTVSFEFLLCTLGFMAVFSLWLVPGGLAWAKSKPNSKIFIPGPSGYPLLGSMLVFSSRVPHRVLSGLSKAFKARSLMAFSVGLSRFVISSEPETAKEILGSSSFADRPVKESAYELLFHRAMGFAPYGEYWRNLRRLSATHLFSPARIGAFEPFRCEMGLKMVNQIRDAMSETGQVEIKQLLHCASLNNVMMTVFGQRFEFGDGGEGDFLDTLVSEGYELLGIFNWTDHFPLLGILDLQGVRKRCRKLVAKVNIFVGKIIEAHRIKRSENNKNLQEATASSDFVDVLLDLDKDHELSDADMIAVLWEMIFRGTDTVAILLEWIMARLVIHQDIQAKAQQEIDAAVGSASRQIRDSDIQNLPYLQSIVKETLRVHPPGPLLSWARMAIHDVHVGSNLVPAKTTAMVNMWAITHDHSVWTQPEKFVPERFMEQEVNILGSDLRLAPFGSGRRVCPGKTMALATVHLWLAQLLQSFKWVPCDENGVDLTEVLHLSMEMKSPLVCKAFSRNHV